MVTHTQKIQDMTQVGFVFLLNLLGRLSRPLALAGLIYWLGITFLHIAAVSWWSPTWAIIQIIAIDIHLILLPSIACSYARRGARASFVMTTIVLLGVIVSFIALFLGLTGQTFTLIRVAMLISLSYVDLDRAAHALKKAECNSAAS